MMFKYKTWQKNINTFNKTSYETSKITKCFMSYECTLLHDIVSWNWRWIDAVCVTYLQYFNEQYAKCLMIIN